MSADYRFCDIWVNGKKRIEYKFMLQKNIIQVLLIINSKRRNLLERKEIKQNTTI